MYYFGILLIFWMIIGILYGIHMIYVSEGYMNLKKFINEDKEYNYKGEAHKNITMNVINNKSLFLIFCILFGVPMIIGDIKFYISYYFKRK